MFTKLIFFLSQGCLLVLYFPSPIFFPILSVSTHALHMSRKISRISSLQSCTFRDYRAIHTSLKILILVHLGSLKDITDDTLYIKHCYDI